MRATEEKLMQLNREVVHLFQEEKYKEAIQLGKKAVEMGKTKLGSRHPNTASAVNNLALLYDRIGDRSAAEPLRQWNRQLFATNTLETQTA
ncbi:MAG: tetratricopeptide repeat protein [Nitrospinota bacterium]